MPYHFHSDLIIRAPFFCFNKYDLDNLEEVLKDEYFRIAVLLANPVFYEIIKRKAFLLNLLFEKEMLTIHKYYNRMCYRPTPFGAFASVTVAQWGPGNHLEFCKDTEAILSLLPDQELSLQIADFFLTNKLVKQDYRLNPTLYKTGKTFRFIKTTHLKNAGAQSFSLESFIADRLSIALIRFCQQGDKPHPVIIDFLIEISESTRKEAEGYLDFLIVKQVLVSTIAPNIVGVDYINRLAASEPLYDEDKFKLIKAMLYEIKNCNTLQVKKINHAYQTVNNLVNVLGLNDTQYKFYANLIRPLQSGGLAPKLQTSIKHALGALSKLVVSTPNKAIENFVAAFHKKFDKQRVPLLIALDPDVGINYGELTAQIHQNSLIEGLVFSEKIKSPQIAWTAVHQLLHKKWVGLSEDEKAIIHLTAKDVDILEDQSSSYEFPPSTIVMFRYLENQLYIENAGGISGTSINGRFTAFNDAVLNSMKLLAGYEEQANPDIIFAEISLVGEGHSDNINRRALCYAYEMPINSISVIPGDNQIALSDLLISVQDNQIILESIRLQKRVIPRLSSSFNFSRNDLAVFRFLCDLQHVGFQSSFNFDLENYFPALPNYPRVTYQDVVLSPAKWKLAGNELNELKSGKMEQRINYLRSLLQDKKIPARVAIISNDRYLVFNLLNSKEVVFFLNCLKGSTTVTIQELLINNNPDTAKLRHKDELYNAQYIALLFRKDKVYQPLNYNELLVKKKKKRIFLPGSEWLYLKIYCSPATANSILTKITIPLISRELKGIIISWFFIRYEDSGQHLRIRVLANPGDYPAILTHIKKRLPVTSPYSTIKAFVIDTYERELERYGGDIIELVESHFYSSSELVIRFLKNLPRSPVSYYSLAFVSVLQMIKLFIFLPKDQLIFINSISDHFFSSLNEKGDLKIALDQKYRTLKEEIRSIINDEDYLKKNGLQRQMKLFNDSIIAIKSQTSAFSHGRKRRLLSDLIHMHVNRIFAEKQKEHEITVIYFLKKFFISAIYREVEFVKN
jgi:lantibiotic biosynthesis protein